MGKMKIKSSYTVDHARADLERSNTNQQYLAEQITIMLGEMSALGDFCNGLIEEFGRQVHALATIQAAIVDHLGIADAVQKLVEERQAALEAAEAAKKAEAEKATPETVTEAPGPKSTVEPALDADAAGQA